MSFLGKMFGVAVGTVAAPAAPVVDAVGKALDGLITSDEERATLQIALEKLRNEPGQLQVELNKIEAAHPSMFVAGWRPGLGWVCVISLGIYYIPRFILTTYLWAAQVITDGALIPYPEAGVGDILALVGTLLGSSVLRTIEKQQGVAR